MKVAFISVHRDVTGYGKSAENFILALDAAGVEVVPIWITLSGQPQESNARIEELENNNVQDIDVVIQNIIPSHFCRVEGAKNIGLFYLETDSFRGSEWQYHCNLMDEIWVVTNEQRQACIDSGVEVPVVVVDPPRDFNKYEQSYETLEIDPFIDDTYKFYTISDLSYRKNVFGIVASFLSEFTSEDNVSLTVKGFVPGSTFEQSFEYFQSSVNEIKKTLQKPDWSYPKISFIDVRFSEEQMNALHQTCDCYVSLSRGEGDGLPHFDAAGFKNLCIYPEWNGPKATLGLTHHRGIDSLVMKRVVGQGNNIPKLYNSDENWYEPSSSMLSIYMREAYEDSDSAKQRAENSYDGLKEKYDLPVAGQKLKEILSNG